MLAPILHGECLSICESVHAVSSRMRMATRQQETEGSDPDGPACLLHVEKLPERLRACVAHDEESADPCCCPGQSVLAQHDSGPNCCCSTSKMWTGASHDTFPASPVHVGVLRVQGFHGWWLWVGSDVAWNSLCIFVTRMRRTTRQQKSQSQTRSQTQVDLHPCCMEMPPQRMRAWSRM